MSSTALTYFNRTILSGGLVVASLAFASETHAAIQTQPTSLSPGDQYRLAFITSVDFLPTSSNIADYNLFVSNAANAVPALAALGAQWNVVGSVSQLIDARQNTGTDPTPAGPTGVPIFRLDNIRIAANYDDLWDDVLENDLIVTEQGNVSLADRVWTGTINSGVATSQFLGTTNPVYGDPTPAPGGLANDFANSNVNGWLFDWAITVSAQGRLPLYAMSSILTVPGDPNVVPEATSVLTWLGLSLAAVVVGSLRRGRQG